MLRTPPRAGGSFCLWLQLEAKSDHIDLRPQEHFLNKAKNQLVNLQTTLEICVFLRFGGDSENDTNAQVLTQRKFQV